MTTNPSTQEAAAMARIRSHINRSAGQHLRAVRSASSEGSESARRILEPRRASLTPDPLLLHTERLHRVDASQLPASVDGAALGHCRTDLGLCMGHAQCADHACQGHPGHDDAADENAEPTARDRAACRAFWLGYAATLAACGTALAYASHLYQFFR